MGGLSPRDFKSLASANFATPAAEAAQWRDFNIEVLVGQGYGCRHTQSDTRLCVP